MSSNEMEAFVTQTNEGIRESLAEFQRYQYTIHHSKENETRSAEAIMGLQAHIYEAQTMGLAVDVAVWDYVLERVGYPEEHSEGLEPFKRVTAEGAAYLHCDDSDPNGLWLRIRRTGGAVSSCYSKIVLSYPDPGGSGSRIEMEYSPYAFEWIRVGS